ncbi:hypothetical protein HD554DRAFT_2168017 [Boletus coccyginus]|nr:hypothetical protein HD554DRAFT_2168017 [Boletus coccyginus]
MTTFQQTLDSLAVPAAFARYDRIVDTFVLASLNAWKSDTEPLLNQLDSSGFSALSVSELADLVCVLAPLTAIAQWSSPATRSLASARLARIPTSDQLVTHILTHIVKPFFAPSPHPRLHTSTARILPRPADVQDTYVEQPWKEHPGIDGVVSWCLLNTESSAYETTWPLFLPPVMSFLDDYQVPYKLRGVRLVFDMLARVPPHLLLRTGVDTLMFNSITNSLSHLGDQSTPDFVRLAVTTTLQLIDLTTPSASPSHAIPLHDNEPQGIPAAVLTHTLSSQSKSLSARFSRLSTLLSSSLLGTVIMYTPTFLPPVSSSAPDPDPFAGPGHMDIDPARVPETPLRAPMPQKQNFNPTLVAAAQSLPPVLSALGAGGVRFLKGTIPVLAEWLALPLPVVATEAGCASDDNEEASPHGVERSHHGSEASTTDVTLHLAALSSLSVLFRTCTPRIGGWSTTIVDAIGQCWVGCLDWENQRRDDPLLKDSLYVLKKQLRETAVQLAGIYPGVIKELQPEKTRLHGGHPSKLTPTNKGAIVQQIITGKVKTAVHATKFINSIIDASVCPQTVRNTLKEGCGEEEEASTF